MDLLLKELVSTYGEIGNRHKARRLEADYADLIRKYEMGFVRVAFEDRIWITSHVVYCSENPAGIIFNGSFVNGHPQQLALFSFGINPETVCRQLEIPSPVLVRVKRSTIDEQVYFVIERQVPNEDVKN